MSLPVPLFLRSYRLSVLSARQLTGLSDDLCRGDRSHSTYDITLEFCLSIARQRHHQRDAGAQRWVTSKYATPRPMTLGRASKRVKASLMCLI